LANADLERFRLKVREYRLLVNRNQSNLAAYLNLDYNELSNHRNAHKNASLSHDNVRGIVRTLAEWGAITTRSQAEALLDLMLCPQFELVDLQTKPLSKLAVAVAVYNADTPGESKPSPLVKPTQPSDPELKHNLPQQLSSFIGRSKEIVELKKLIIQDKVPLITLLGAGGSGKTRLSI
jgi:hypothetical protein